MAKEDVLKDIQSLIEDIDKCTRDYTKLLLSKEPDKVKLGYVTENMSRLMVAAHQNLSFLYDYINGLWKDAQSEELPEIDREVIALVGIPSFEDSTEYVGYKVAFAHRPYQGKYIGKSLISGNVETFENKVYDKGGWNQPNVRFWLDLDLPVKEGGDYGNN